MGLLYMRLSVFVFNKYSFGYISVIFIIALIIFNNIFIKYTFIFKKDIRSMIIN